MKSPQRSLAIGLAMLTGSACSATDDVDPPGYLFSGGTNGLTTGGRANAGGVGFTGGRSTTSASGGKAGTGGAKGTGGKAGTGGAKGTGGKAGTGGRRTSLT